MITLYHGTSAANARRIAKDGFVPDKAYNWNIKSKQGFVYLSEAYAPFYAMSAKQKGVDLALIKCEVHPKDLYPEDDFLMCVVKRLPATAYTQAELDAVDLEDYKHLWKKSLEYMGNAAARPDRVKVLGIREFDGKQLIHRCDPVIGHMNFMIMGDWYKGLTEWIYEGKDYMAYPSFGPSIEQLKAQREAEACQSQ